MEPAAWRHLERVWLSLPVLVSAAALASPTGGYDANHDQRLGSPTTEQTDRALEAGEKFRDRQPAAPPPQTPVAIPESYSTKVSPDGLTMLQQEPGVDEHWRWGPRVFWPCESVYPYWEYSIYLWGDGYHDRRPRRSSQRDLFEMWCPPLRDRITRHPHDRGER